MAKSSKAPVKVYPDLSRFFALKEEARLAKAEMSPSEKLAELEQIREISKIFKSAKIIKKGGVQKD
jgi:hypothetical protein